MAESEKLREVTVNASMTKPLMLLGCDRALLSVCSLFCFYVGFMVGLVRGEFGIMFLAIVLWIVLHSGLKKMGKADPLMLDVFKRSSQYSGGRMFATQFHFPARSAIHVKTSQITKKRWL